MPQDAARTAAAADQRAQVIHTLALDMALAEVVAALSTARLQSLLLKGPALARWLYPDPLDRRYGDIDLLVDPVTFSGAERVLSRLGFVKPEAPASPHHAVWSRPGRLPVIVELHRSLALARCPDALVWSSLSADPDELIVGVQPVAIPHVPGRLVVVALHAAQHGRGFGTAVTDLHLALEKVGPTAWHQAARLADRLGALEPFGAGLRLDPKGAQIAERLGIAVTDSRKLVLQLMTPPPTAMGFERLAAAEGARERVDSLAREIFPSPGFMRMWQPVAQRGRVGLAIAYGWRPLWLLWKARAGLRAWSQAKRSADAVPSSGGDGGADRDRRREPSRGQPG